MTLKETINGYIKDFLRQRREYQLLIGAVCLALIGTGGYFAYRWHSNQKQRLAQVAFTDSLEMYHQALAATFAEKSERPKADLWDEVALAFRLAYEQNKNSTYAPFFLLYQAQASAFQGSIEQALALVEQARSLLPRSSHFHYLVGVTQALLKLRTSEEQGIASLQQLASDPKNSLAVMAQYYCGEYFLSKHDRAHALEYFQQAADYKSSKKEYIQSPWVRMAKERVQQL